MSSRCVIVMGVSGSGKTTVARGIAQEMGWTFAEGDDFHSEENVAKMARGVALTDDDRWPWLREIGAWISAREQAGQSAVITCSALKRTYRDLLREGRSGVQFVLIDVPVQELERRLVARTDHYMSPSLLPSQLATLEPLQDDEPGIVVHAADTPQETVQRALVALA
ncbi:gluconokinase [Dermatophilaceae bacterium Sec6.4]